jgi:hypothetical protein
MRARLGPVAGWALAWFEQGGESGQFGKKFVGHLSNPYSIAYWSEGVPFGGYSFIGQSGELKSMYGPL